MIILYVYCSVPFRAILNLLLLMLFCFLLLNFLLCLFVFMLPLAYIHPTHTSPLELHMKHHTVALQSVSACCFGVQAAA